MRQVVLSFTPWRAYGSFFFSFFFLVLNSSPPCRAVDVPVVMQRQMPTIQKVQKTNCGSSAGAVRIVDVPVLYWIGFPFVHRQRVVTDGLRSPCKVPLDAMLLILYIAMDDGAVDLDGFTRCSAPHHPRSSVPYFAMDAKIDSSIHIVHTRCLSVCGFLLVAAVPGRVQTRGCTLWVCKAAAAFVRKSLSLPGLDITYFYPVGNGSGGGTVGTHSSDDLMRSGTSIGGGTGRLFDTGDISSQSSPTVAQTRPISITAST